VYIDILLGNIDDLRTYSTDFVEKVVWHNNHLITSAQRRLYCDIVERVI